MRAKRLASTLAAMALLGTVGAVSGAVPAQAASGDYSYVLNNAQGWDGANPWFSYGGYRVQGSQWARSYCYTDAFLYGRLFKLTAKTQVGWATIYVQTKNIPNQASLPHC